MPSTQRHNTDPWKIPMKSPLSPTTKSFAVLSLQFAAIFLAPPVDAHDQAMGIVKERMEAMKSIAKATKAMTAMVRGQEPYDAEAFREQAAMVERLAGEALTELFPEDSLEEPTEALPGIWRDWEKFETLADELREHSDRLTQANGEEPLRSAYADLVKTCGACHKAFRAEEADES